MDDEGLADRFYEAALAPDLWPAALSAFARRFDGSCAVLIARGPDGVRFATSTGDDHIVHDWIAGGWEARSDKIDRCLRLDPKAFITEANLYTPEELRSDPAYEGFYRPRNIGAEFGTLFAMPTGDLLVASVQRRFGAPPQDAPALAAGKALRPHLARAALIAARLDLDRSRGAMEALATLGMPAASLSSKARLIVGNDLLAALMPETVRDVRGRLVFADRAAGAALEGALEGIRAAGGRSAGCSIPIPGGRDGTPTVAHVIPVVGAGRDVFVSAACVLVFTRASALPPPDTHLLTTLFGLTPAEARVARSTVRLGGVPAAADELNLSRETVRTQLRAVLGKTGVASQQGLTALLTSLAAGAPARRRA